MTSVLLYRLIYTMYYVLCIIIQNHIYYVICTLCTIYSYYMYSVWSVEIMNDSLHCPSSSKFCITSWIIKILKLLVVGLSNFFSWICTWLCVLVLAGSKKKKKVANLLLLRVCWSDHLSCRWVVLRMVFRPCVLLWDVLS